MKIYLDNFSSKKKIVTMGKRIAGGGAGDIHKIKNNNIDVLKIYKTSNDRALYAPKIKAMLLNTPELDTSIIKNKMFHQLAWPNFAAYDKIGNFLGFSMPEIDFKNSVSLERMLQKKIRHISKLPEFYGYRVSLVYNIATCVSILHKIGHHIIDFKPINCRLDPDTMLISIIDCDGFSINNDKDKYPAHQFTPEYIAPEAFNKKPEMLGVEQDLFSLAVIIFELLNNGIHPYQCKIPKNKKISTIQEMINNKCYAYAKKNNTQYEPSVLSVHSSFPDDIRILFDQAFLTKKRPTAIQWKNTLKDYANPQSGKLIKCKNNPKEHAHFGKGCGFCAIENRFINAHSFKKNYKSKGNINKLNINTKSKTLTTSSNIKKYSINPNVNLNDLHFLNKIPSFFMALVAVIIICLLNTDGSNVTSKPVKINKPNIVNNNIKTDKLSPNIISPSILDFSQIKGEGITIKNTNFRYGPGTNYNIINVILKGKKIYITGRHKNLNWYSITYNNTQGFIHGDNLNLTWCTKKNSTPLYNLDKKCLS